MYGIWMLTYVNHCYPWCQECAKPSLACAAKLLLFEMRRPKLQGRNGSWRMSCWDVHSILELLKCQFSQPKLQIADLAVEDWFSEKSSVFGGKKQTVFQTKGNEPSDQRNGPGEPAECDLHFPPENSYRRLKRETQHPEQSEKPRNNKAANCRKRQKLQ